MSFNYITHAHDDRAVAYEEWGDLSVANVTRGITLLDIRFMGRHWRGRINPDTFSLSCPYRCVIGQVYGDMWAGLGVLGMHKDDLRPYGFDHWPTDEEMAVVEDVWIEFFRTGAPALPGIPQVWRG